MRRMNLKWLQDGGAPSIAAGAIFLACSGSGDENIGPGTGTGGEGASDGTGGEDAASSGSGGSSSGGTGALPDDECAGSASPTPEAPAAPSADPNRQEAREFFRLHVRAEDGAPLRGATVKTVGKVVYTTDDNGNVAFDEPGQTGINVYFHVGHPGFEVPADAFGYHGKALPVAEGGTGEIVMLPTSGDEEPAQGDLATRLTQSSIPGKSECLALRIIDPANDRGVPLVKLSAFGEEYWSDSQGMVAYCSPDQLGSSVSFEVMSHGYALPNGASSVDVMATAGSDATIEVERQLAAERLYRITGSGIYRDSFILGLTTPTAFPVLNAQVIGSDTVDTTIYQGKVFWLWQDTDRVAYPLGNFSGTAATSILPEDGGLAASTGVDPTYFVGSDGFARAISEPFEPSGPVWMAGLISVPDANDEEQLFASFAKVSGVASPLVLGMMKWNPASETFERVLDDFLERQTGDPEFVRPDGYAFKFQTNRNETHVYYPARLRIPAQAEALADPTTYETFTAYDDKELKYREDGKLDYAYRTSSLPTSSTALQEADVPRDQDLDDHFQSLSGTPVALIQTHSAYNPYRRRFLRQAQVLGDWGELYYAEADTPMGPWVYTEKVITHDAYTFYNPSPHPEFDEGEGRFIFFEGTYTTFLQSTEPTPRYDYNQIMYRLDVDDDRVVLPVPLYDVSKDLPGQLTAKQGLRPTGEALSAPMMAYDRPKQGALAVRWSGAECVPGRRLVISETPQAGDLFYALPSDDTGETTIPLYEYQSTSGDYAYSVEEALSDSALTRSAEPLVRVFQNPIQVPLPVGDYLGFVADAGEDQCLSVSQGATAEVELTASAPGNTPVKSIRWKTAIDDACIGAEGVSAKFDLPPGTHAIIVEVESAAGEISFDTVLVTVSEDS